MTFIRFSKKCVSIAMFLVLCLSRLDHSLEQILSTKKFIEKVIYSTHSRECVFVNVKISNDGEVDDDEDVETIKSIYLI